MICGMRASGERKAEPLDTMLAALPGRERDGVTVWTDGAVTLGWLGASASDDEGTGCLPLADRGARLVVTASCRLDDRASLCDVLDVPGAQRGNVPDGALILRAYERWGTDCPGRLLGDYAFAVWDAPRRRLLCARDHAGARPLYYCLIGDRIVFASDVAAVLAAPGVPDDPDEAALATRLAGALQPLGERTFFRAVRRLPPGHRLVVEDGAARVERWWRPEDVPAVAGDDDSFAEAFLEIYSRAVEDRLRSALRVGVHLSGGLDSSSIAVLAARARRRAGLPAPPAFCWQPPPGAVPASAEGTSEHDLIEAVRRQEGLHVRYCPLGVEDVVAWLRRDGALDLNVHINETAVQRAAAESGVRVLLSGWGGDEGISFNGRGYPADLLRKGRLGALWREVRQTSRYPLAGLVTQALLPLAAPAVAATLSRWRRGHGPGQKVTFIHPVIARRARPLPDPYRRLPAGGRRLQLHLLRGGHLAERIDGWAASGARHGIEYRYPLLDRRVLEFALGLPPEQFRRGRWSRWLMRRALDGTLPPEVCWHRDKRDPARIESMDRASTEALVAVRTLLDARPVSMSRSAYVDTVRVLDRLDRVSADSPEFPGALINALRFLDF